MTPGLQHPRKCCCPRASPSGNNTSSGVTIPGSSGVTIPSLQDNNCILLSVLLLLYYLIVLNRPDIQLCMVISYFTLQDVQPARKNTTWMIQHALAIKHTTTVLHDETVTNLYLYKYDYNDKIKVLLVVRYLLKEQPHLTWD